jgi:hypothetical protein
MAGLKETQFSDSPVAFWTFDEDRAGFEGNQILDEINNQNPLVIHGEKYDLEQQGLNPIELTDQYSLKVAKDGYAETNYTDYNTFFEGVHSTAFNFPDRGQFSIEFLYYKQGTNRGSGQPYRYSNVTSPILKKGSVVRVDAIDYYSSSTDRLNCTVLGRTVNCLATEYPVFWKTNHVVITYEVNQIDVNEYESIIRLYVNGRQFGYNRETHVDSYPNTSVIDSWLFAGDGGTNAGNDFQTELLTLDNIAVYDYALTESQISNHYRKTKQYDDLVKDDYPQHYWRFNDEETPLDYGLTATVGTSGLNRGAVTRQIDGPEKLVIAQGTKYDIDATASVESYGTYGQANTIFSINQNYTWSMWFKSGDNGRGVMVACIEENRPWDGLTIWLNSKNNKESPGNVQIGENLYNHVSSRDTNPQTGERENWNDDVWHHLGVRRTADNYLELWLDGELNNRALYGRSSNGRPSQLHFMGMGPGEQNITGTLCEVAFFQYAWQDIQFMSHYLFTTRYRISGYTLLQGTPIQATVRFYNHITGELQEEAKTDSVTGEYVYYPPSNNFVDIMSFIPDNKTTRYRVHGPVKPAEFDDSHLI